MLQTWPEQMEQCGALWRHDGNPKRPYALWTSGLIADTYCDCNRFFAVDGVLERVAGALLYRVKQIIPKHARYIVLGPRRGGKTLADAIAKQLHAVSLGTRWEDESKTCMQVENLPENSGEGFTLLPVDDVISTAMSISAAISACQNVAPKASLSPAAFCVVNYSGTDKLGEQKIFSLIELKANFWRRGENPFTSDGKELVEPVANPKENWEILNRDY